MHDTLILIPTQSSQAEDSCGVPCHLPAGAPPPRQPVAHPACGDKASHAHIHQPCIITRGALLASLPWSERAAAALQAQPTCAKGFCLGEAAREGVEINAQDGDASNDHQAGSVGRQRLPAQQRQTFSPPQPSTGRLSQGTTSQHLNPSGAGGGPCPVPFTLLLSNRMDAAPSSNPARSSGLTVPRSCPTLGSTSTTNSSARRKGRLLRCPCAPRSVGRAPQRSRRRAGTDAMTTTSERLVPWRPWTCCSLSALTDISV